MHHAHIAGCYYHDLHEVIEICFRRLPSTVSKTSVPTDNEVDWKNVDTNPIVLWLKEVSFGTHTETIGLLTDLWIADYCGSISAAQSFCWAVSYKSRVRREKLVLLIEVFSKFFSQKKGLSCLKI